MVVRSKHSIKRKRKGTRLNGKTKRTKTVQKGGKCEFHSSVTKKTKNKFGTFGTSTKPMKVCTVPYEGTEGITVIIWSDNPTSDDTDLILDDSTSMYFPFGKPTQLNNPITISTAYKIDLKDLKDLTSDIDTSVVQKGSEKTFVFGESNELIIPIETSFETRGTKSKVLKAALTYLLNDETNEYINQIPWIRTMKLLKLLKFMNKHYHSTIPPRFNRKFVYRKSTTMQKVNELKKKINSLSEISEAPELDSYVYYKLVKELFKNSWCNLAVFFHFFAIPFYQNEPEKEIRNKVAKHFQKLFNSNNLAYIVFCQFIQNLKLVNDYESTTQMSLDALAITPLLPLMGILSKDEYTKKLFKDKLKYIFDNLSILYPIIPREVVDQLLPDVGDYLVRTRKIEENTECPKCPFTISVKGEDGSVHHYLIEEIEEIEGIKYKIIRTGTSAISIEELIKSIKKNQGNILHQKLTNNVLMTEPIKPEERILNTSGRKNGNETPLNNSQKSSQKNSIYVKGPLLRREPSPLLRQEPTYSTLHRASNKTDKVYNHLDHSGETILGGTRHKKTRKNKRRYKKSKRTFKKNKRRSNKKQTRKFK